MSTCGGLEALSWPEQRAIDRHRQELAALWHRDVTLDEALEHYQAAARINPVSDFAINNIGVIMAKRGDLEGAEREYAKALEINPGYSMAVANVGLVRYARGDYAGALASLEQSRRMGFDDPELHYKIGVCLEALSRAPEAIASYERALNGNATLRDARYRMAAILLRRGERARARELAAGELALDPAHAGARGIMRLLQPAPPR